MVTPLNNLAQSLIEAFSAKPLAPETKDGISVNPIVSEIATWYEKVRNAMDYREDEVVLRAAIERILRRKFLLGGSGKTVAPALIRELLWARYFPDASIPEKVPLEVAKRIDLYLSLRRALLKARAIKDQDVDDLTYQLLSCDIALLLKPNPKKDLLTNFVFHVLKDNVTIAKTSEQTRDVQVYIAVCQLFAKDDLAFLRYRLFQQYFGELSESSLSAITNDFTKGYQEISNQLTYSKRHKIAIYVKRQMPTFFILEDVLLTNSIQLSEILNDSDKRTQAIIDQCHYRYTLIRQKVNRAIIRSLIFVLLTKVFFAFAVESTLDKMVYGAASWQTLVLTIVLPPTLLVIASLFIRTPKDENTQVIVGQISNLLTSQSPTIGKPLIIKPESKKTMAIIDIVFSILWLLTFVISFGSVSYLLTILHFTVIDQAVFLFFLAIVAFFIYRVSQVARTYSVIRRQNALTPVIDFFFVPIAQVGRYLAEGFAQVNIFLFLLDIIFETPFKGLFGFIEQWFFYIHAKRDYLE